MAKHYQLKITLADSKPAIWRSVITPSDINLNEFHYLIQIVMQWTNSHLHLFVVNDVYYGDDRLWEGEMEDMIESRTTLLAEVLVNKGDRLLYEYDMGDGWKHEVILKKIIKDDTLEPYPVCLDGKRHGPLEDTGGIYGYESFVKDLNNKRSPEYYDHQDWMEANNFYPEIFDIKSVNKLLVNFKKQVKLFEKWAKEI